ncbi:hypothetical protein V5799_005133 [Amblyomma americanum]|uniref:Uncharacterized protein n=1 Tax=Amblyomma americanum TaxID=6943 RepID=A0AAQ4E046_AMBAM
MRLMTVLRAPFQNSSVTSPTSSTLVPACPTQFSTPSLTALRKPCRAEKNLQSSSSKNSEREVHLCISRKHHLRRKL